MLATFGPSRATLAQLANTTYGDWIQQQMAMPAELHLEYFRQRANPRYEDHMSLFNNRGGSFTERAKCDRGSRWEEVDETVVGSFSELPNSSFTELMPGVLLLNQTEPSNCGLKDYDFIKVGNSYFRHSRRLELFDNLPGNPRELHRADCPQEVDPEMCRILPPSGQCWMACGIVGEVANDPFKGFHFPFLHRKHDSYDADENIDTKHRYKLKDGKRVVWTMKAMYGADQLRQRVGWALSQIFVAAPNPNKDNMNERWLHFYDLFMIHAFGNFRDLLGAVTYHPTMILYLTYKENWAFDHDKAYADENYAREVMQLFTIGLDLLNPDGTPQLDTNGNTIPTYDNRHIESFARVFTGFTTMGARTNSEGDCNIRDVPKIRVDRHDIYPKPNLKGGFIGDGVPLCSDLRTLSHLAAGAKYEFRGYRATNGLGDDVYQVPKASPLWDALCQLGLDGKCVFDLVRILKQDVPCSGDECNMETVRIIKVKNGNEEAYFEYVPPTCVHFFFFNGRRITRGGLVGRGTSDPEESLCADPAWPIAGASCCINKKCTDIPSGGKACSRIKTSRLQCDSSGSWRQKHACALSCYSAGKGYPGDDCSQGGGGSEERVCGHSNEAGVQLKRAEELCAAKGLEICAGDTARGSCGFNSRHSFVWTPVPCSTFVVVHWDGQISAHTEWHEGNRFPVKWQNGTPTPGNYTVTVQVSPVFSSVPSRDQFMAEIDNMIGAFDEDCGNSKVCGSDGVVCFCGPLNENTVLHFEGRFFKNLRSLVDVGGHTFRNPPVFLIRDPAKSKAHVTDYSDRARKQVVAEVDAHLDHLFHHQNTAPFISKLLIQRLVKSNPSPAYVEAVANAFKTGEYAGTTHSGKYGDLAATVSAILLHPEALAELDGAYDGALREPILKILHFMRAMEFEPTDTMTAFGPLFDYTGQAPYMSPTVFNFYQPDFMPASFESDGKFAPEFEIFHGPTAVGLFNGLVSLVENGLMDDKWKNGELKRPGFGLSYSGAQGVLTFKPEGSTADNVVEELNLLLAGGRLTELSKEVAREAFDAGADEQAKLKAAQTAIVVSPEFNTYGPILPAGPTERGFKEELHPPRDYKAVVIIQLSGGADSWNFAVPLECAMYEEYKQIRTNIALTKPEDFIKVATAGQSCAHFGIHASMPTVASLYEDGEAAIVTNIGALVEPLDRASFMQGGKTCVGLYSHADMRNALQTSVCQVKGGTPKGVGGRMADALKSGSQQMSAKTFSMFGHAFFAQGTNTSYQTIDSKTGAVKFHYKAQLNDTIANLTRQKFGNKFCEEYASSLIGEMHEQELLSDRLEAVDTVTEFLTKENFYRQLRQVARLIQARDARKAERDFFIVEYGHWDMHKSLDPDFAEQAGVLDDAIKEFVDELKELKVFDKVVLATSSDFGRTLTSNGDGADHAWGGQHFIISGAIHGGRVYNDYPKTLLAHNESHTNDQDAGRGRLIPKYPWESMMVPIARWVGVEESQMSTVFPNLGNFNSSTHIISSESGAPLFFGQ